MNLEEPLDEILRYEMLQVIRFDDITIAEYVRIEVVLAKSYKRNRQEREVFFIHQESEQEFPMAMVPVIEELIAENLFQIWLQERMKDGRANEASSCAH